MRIFWTILRQPIARVVVAVAMLCVIISWVGVIWQIREDSATAVQSALRENRSRVVAFEQYVRRTLEAADLAASYLDEHYGPLANQPGAALPRLITLPSYYHPVIAGAEIADRDGNIRFTTKQRGPVNVRDKRVFRELRDAPGGARAISNPTEPPGTQGAVLLIARSLRDPQGRFAGAVAVDIPVPRFVDFNAGFRYRRDDLISIISARGITLARREGDTVSWGQDLTGTLVMQRQQVDPDGEYWGPSVLDGKRRLFSHQRLAAYPIFVTSGMGEDDILGPARWRAGWFLSLAAALTLVVGILLVLFFRHIHNQQQAQRRFDVMRDEFAHSARVASMNEMAAGLAHELNQPLSAAANFLAAGELLLGDGASGSAVGHLHQARGQIARAGEIIRRIRDYLANGSAEFRAERIDDTIQDAIGLAGGAAMTPRARILYAGPRPALRVLIDRVQIQQVLVNLIRNAEQAMAGLPPERRTIRIATEILSDDLLRISVTDQGPGIPDAVFRHFNMPFISTKSGEEGLGIGLSICRRIIEAHGGALEARNLAQGAMVWFTVARAPAIPAAA